MANEAPNKKQVRVWADGCFDMMHFGHANALRQAKECGDYLVVGVHSDKEIERHKGPPVMNEQERYAAVRACKWVDEVVEDAPYVTQLSVLDQYNIDFCVHGEDITTDEHGRDCYEEVRAAGRFKIIKRTPSVSTTNLVGRMLLLTKDHLDAAVRAKAHQKGADTEEKSLSVVKDKSPYTGVGTFLPSTTMVSLFAAGCRERQPDDVVVYVVGAFDMFHVGHIAALRKAREFGTYLVVGIHNDDVVHQKKGRNLPIMSLHERVLNVLQCRYVDEVITGAPWDVTEHVILSLNISVVAAGSTDDYSQFEDDPQDPYAIPKQKGIFRNFQSPMPELTTSSIIERILTHRTKYEARNRKKEKGEIALIKQQQEQYASHEKATQDKKAEILAKAASSN